MKQIEEEIKEEIKNCLFNVNCMTLAVKQYRKYDNIYNWAVAISSFGSATMWILEDKYAIVNATIIAVSQFLFAIKPLMGFTKHVRTLNKRCYTQELLFLELLELWNLVKREEITTTRATDLLNSLRKRITENEFFDDGDDFEYSQKIIDKAQEITAESLMQKYKITE
jgi:hypothetical protein